MNESRRRPSSGRLSPATFSRKREQGFAPSTAKGVERRPSLGRAMRERGRDPFSRLWEKVAGDSRPDEALGRDSFRTPHVL